MANEPHAVPSEEFGANPWVTMHNSQSNFLNYPSATSFVRNMFYFSTAWQIKSKVPSFAFSSLPSLISSRLSMLCASQSSALVRPAYYSPSTSCLWLVFWLGIPSSLHQIDLPVSTPLFLNSLSPHRSHDVSVKTQSNRVTSALKILAQLAIYHKVQSSSYHVYKAWPNLELLVSLMSSPTTLSLLSSTAAMLAYLLLLQHPKHVSISEPLHSLFSLPVVIFSHFLAHSFPSFWSLLKYPWPDFLCLPDSLLSLTLWLFYMKRTPTLPLSFPLPTFVSPSEN